MLFNLNLDQIRIEESQLVIDSNIKNKKIPVQDIKKVYVSVSKIPIQYQIVYVLLGGICIGLNFNFYPVGLFFWIICILYFVGQLFLHNYKSCTLNLELNNGIVKFRFIPFQRKFQVINKINEIKYTLALSKEKQ